MTSIFKVFFPRVYHTGRQLLLKSKRKSKFTSNLQTTFMHNMSEHETSVAAADRDIKDDENCGKRQLAQDKSQTSEGNTGTLSRRACKKFERMKKWKQQQGKKPKSRKPDAPEPGFGAHLYEETEYYYENGLRKVYPYYYTFTTYVKQRWLGRTILDVFSSEFRAHSEQDYMAAIENGHLTVNGKKVSSDYVLKDNELLAHRLHRHENPVVGCPIKVLSNTDDLIVINKPSSIPCHPCGKYRHNSVVFIVGRQMGCANLRNELKRKTQQEEVFIRRWRPLQKQDMQKRIGSKITDSELSEDDDDEDVVDADNRDFFDIGIPEGDGPDGGLESDSSSSSDDHDGAGGGDQNIYRLDRLTSGVLIMGKTSKKTKELEDQVLKRLIRKEYVCRVVGEFSDEKIECKEPIGVISQKLGLFRVRPDGKPCHTTFEKLSFNGKTSVVRCCPHTGRTHQIRVHLQYLGHPIVNDPFYNSEAWGPNKNKGGIMERTDQEVSDRLMVLHNIGHWTEGVNPLYAERLKEIAEADHKHPEGDEAEESRRVLDTPTRTLDDTTGMRNIGGNSGTSSSDTVGTSTINRNNGGVSGTGVLPGESQEPPAKKTRTEESEVISLEQMSAEVTSLGQMSGEESSASEKAATQDVSETGCTGGHLPPFDRSKWIPDENCQSCQLKYVDPTQEELVMYLHALKYTGPDWEYSTPLPDWAEEDWVED